MRVAIDTNGLYTAQAGEARHIRGLLRGLAGAVEAVEVAWKVENFGFRQPERALKTFYRELFWGPFLAGGQIDRARPDLLHTTGAIFYRPRPGLAHVATLHDLAVLRTPGRFRRWQARAARQTFARIAAADRVLCISQFTADEAMTLLALPASKIAVVHNGCDYSGAEPPPANPPKEPVPGDFLLFVGSLEPGKNLALLKDVYRLAAEAGKSLPALVIVGARWAGVPGEGPPPANWHYLGRQPDAALVHLYRRARALVFPSKYEGFGLPVAEAMALGCPVICSRVASVPEVAGDAAFYAELTAPSYLDAIIRLTKDDALRKDLIARGAVQSSRFTWEKCARETVAVYESTLR
jgi:alpha-1,3-rhamnosyl/mannosyltransferase